MSGCVVLTLACVVVCMCRIQARWICNIPSRFWNQKPHANGEGQTNTSVEPARLETPVPLILVDHIGCQLVHSNADNTSACCSKSCGVRSETLGRDFTDKAPACRSIRCHADVCSLKLAENLCCMVRCPYSKDKRRVREHSQSLSSE